jgi:hypothetical protein
MSNDEYVIQIGTLVEVQCSEENMNGIRLYVTAHRRDSDGTPLYSLGLKGETDISKMYHGHPNSVLTIVH